MSINHGDVICSLDLDKNGNVTSRIIKVPLLTNKKVKDESSENEKFFNSTRLLGFANSDVTIKNSKKLLKQLTDVENQNPKFMSLLKNISRHKIRFDNDAFYHAIKNEEKHELMVSDFVKTDIVQASSFLVKDELNILTSKVIRQINETLQERSEKVNIIAIALTGRFFDGYVNYPIIYADVAKTDAKVAIDLCTCIVMKHFNIVSAFLETSPIKEEITSVLYDAYSDVLITYEYLNLILIALMELNKIIVEKDKINEKNEFSLFYQCHGKFITFIKTLYSFANEYYEVENGETLRVNQELERLNIKEQDKHKQLEAELMKQSEINKKITLAQPKKGELHLDIDEWYKKKLDTDKPSILQPLLDYKSHIIFLLLGIFATAFYIYSNKQRSKKKPKRRNYL
jgi:hypothetical protein